MFYKIPDNLPAELEELDAYIVRYQSGEMALVEATPKAYAVKGSFDVPSAKTATGGKGWPHPVIYHGRLYLRCEDQILCYDIRQK